MALVYLAAGSNLGERESHLQLAQSCLEKLKSTRVRRTSPIYETKPVGGPEQGNFLNAVWEIETLLTPQELLQGLLDIEALLGRVRKVKNGPRTIDLDILFYDAQVIKEEGITIPHPRLHEREFVLRPLADLVPELVHPVLRKKIKELLPSP